MTTFTYDNTVPAASNDPSNDQPLMLTNAQSIASIWDVDHIGFGAANGGTHNKATLRAQGSVPVSIADEIILYSKDDSNAVPQLFFAPESAATPVQMTTKPSGAAAVSIGANGYTFLPGGLLLQWGSTVLNTTSQAITFPVAFTTLYNIQLTSKVGASGGSLTSFKVSETTPSTTGFTAITAGSNSGFYWMAIGAA